VNRALLTLGLAAMHVCWIYPWSLLVVRWVQPDPTQPLLSASSMFALIALGALATRAIIRGLGIGRPGQLTLVGTGVLAVLLAVRIDHYPGSGIFDWLGALGTGVAVLLGRPSVPALALMLGLLLWWRGVQLASDTPTFPDVDTAFRWNVGALICFALVLALGTPARSQPLLEAQATPFVVGSFFVSLLTLALARLESLRSSTRALALNSQWLGVLVAVTGLLVLAALAVAQVLSFDLLLLATRPVFDLLGRILLVLLYIVVIPLAYVIQLVVYWLLSLFSPDLNRAPPEPYSPADISSFLERLFGQLLPPEAFAVLKAIGAVLLLAAALLLVARTIARWRPRLAEADATLEERDSVFDARRLGAALLAWLRGLFQRARSAPVSGASGAPSLPASDAIARLSSVRELYRHLLALGDAAGSQRTPPTTPYEHLPALERTLEPRAFLGDLTQAYVDVRYAEAEPSSDDVAELRELLARVHPAAQSPDDES
jgi:hypothetical protein